MQPDTWILIGDAARARLFATHGVAAPWQLVQAYVHPMSMAKIGEIMADKAGRVQQSTGGGMRSAADPRTEAKEVEAQHFAQELGGVLADGHARNKYKRLVLVAPPHFLGLLRKVLSDPVSKAVVASVGKDLAEIPDHELPRRLADDLR